MSDATDVPGLLEEAEQAATAGDLTTADDRLRAAARLQESALGPHDPELARTLNNLAIVAEKTGRPDEAERYYRRAFGIVAVALPADDPMVTATRENLEDFCRAQGIAVDTPHDVRPSAHEAAAGLDSFDGERPEGFNGDEAVDDAAAADPAVAAAAPTAPAVLHAEPAVALPDRPPHTPPPAPRPRSAVPRTLVAGVVAATVLLVWWWQPWSASGMPPSEQTTREQTTPEPAPTSARSAPATAPVPDPPVASAPEAAAAPTLPATASTSPAPSPARGAAQETPLRSSAGDVSLVAVELCGAFAPRGAEWRCEPAGPAVESGAAVVMYTRVRSPRAAAVVHRWYRNEAVVQSVRLSVGANPGAGYRTYSRQTVTGPADWRVEVRTPGGELLHERRFSVR